MLLSSKGFDMKKLLFMTFVLLMTFNVFAHNENQYGPHGGYIRMPGTYHTELVPKENQLFNIYLLDVNIKNPTTKNSSVSLSYQGKTGTKTSYKCIKVKDYFSCSLDSKVAVLDLKSGALIVEASREGKTGKAVEYSLPLSLDSSAPAHSKMHH